MLYMSFISIISTIILYLCTLFNQKAKSSVNIINGILLIILFGLNYLNSYFMLPSRNLLSIIGYNVLNGFVFLILCWGIFSLNELNLFKSGLIKLSSLALVVLGLFTLCILEPRSAMSVKPTYNSINVEKMKTSEAPTFKRGETPVALSPVTVMNRIGKSMSDVPNSQYYTLGQTQAQYYKGEPVYVVPLEFNGFFAYYQSHKTIPGYFIINATSVNSNPKFIKHNINYSNTSYFGRNVVRKMYRDFPTWLVVDNSAPQMEIDDNGTPYYVQTVYKPENLSHRIDYKDLHVLATNTQTGKTTLYSLKNLPSWIDEGITDDVANSMNYDYGHYKYGWWNIHFGQRGVEQAVDDNVISIFNKNHTISYFTDFTNPNSGADSALGYSMINARTGKLSYYKTQNIMDSSGARHNADQNYKAQHWSAHMPVIYNIDNRPVWVLSVLDSTGAFRGYVYIAADDQSIYATGSNANSTLDNFRQALVNSGSSAGNTQGVNTKTITGQIDRVAVLTNSVVFSLKNSKTIYTVDSSDFPSSQLARPNDKVSFKAKILKNKSVGNISSFNDLTFNK